MSSVHDRRASPSRRCRYGCVLSTKHAALLQRLTRLTLQAKAGSEARRAQAPTAAPGRWRLSASSLPCLLQVCLSAYTRRRATRQRAWLLLSPCCSAPSPVRHCLCRCSEAASTLWLHADSIWGPVCSGWHHRLEEKGLHSLPGVQRHLRACAAAGGWADAEPRPGSHGAAHSLRCAC